MKKIIFVLLSALIPSCAFADVSINLDVEAPSGTLYNAALTVTPCPVTNDPATTTVSAKCALEQAGQNPQWTNYGGDDWFLTAAGGASQDFGNNLYWNWWANLSYGQVALNKHEPASGESLLIALGVLPLRIDDPGTVTVGATTTVTVEAFGFDTNYNGVWGPSASTTLAINGAAYKTGSSGTADFVATSTGTLTLTASKSGSVSATRTLTPTAVPAPAPAPTVSGGGGGGVRRTTPSVADALSYLVSKQNADGSFSSPFLSDWAALAFAAADPGTAKTALRQYLTNASPSLSSVTDYERHAMALEALGINPYLGAPADYVTPIVQSFDGTQIGDASLDNDDIFALFPLLHAGYTPDDTIIRKTVAFILSRQAPNGAWDASSDMTAAAVEALAQVSALQGVMPALAQAETYLRSGQHSDGGFGNSFTTSWVLQAIAAFGEPQSSWSVPTTGYFGTDYLGALQESDGGIEPVSTDATTRVWATAYAVPATLGKDWPVLLQPFPRPNTNAGTDAQTGALTLSDATSTPLFAATSTIPVATSTPPAELVSTSTPPVSAATVSVATTSPGLPHHTARVSLAAVQAKTPAAIPFPALVDRQPAAAASAPASVLLGHLWYAVVSFLGRWL